MSSPRLPLSSRPTFLPDEISKREFATVFRGYDPAEVRTFLNQLSEQSGDLADRVAEVQKALIETEDRIKNPELTEEMVTSLLGEQTAQILRSAREAGAETRRKTDEEVGRQLRDAHEVTSRMKEEAETLLRERTEEADSLMERVRNEANEYSETTRAEADQYAADMRGAANEDATRIRNDIRAEAERRSAELDSEILRKREQAERDINDERTRARQESRDIIDTARVESQSLVERTQARQTELIEGLVRRRKIALAQLDSLRAGRARLLDSYKMVRTTLDDVTRELEKVEGEARNAGVQAGQRAAEASELEPNELDQEIEMEQFELEDDVPETVLALVESEETVSLTEPFDLQASDDTSEEELEETSDVIDINSGEPQPTNNGGGGNSALFDLDTATYDDDNDSVVNLTVIDGQNNEPAQSSPSHDHNNNYSGPTSTLTREINEVETEQVQSASTLIIGDVYGQDEDARSLKLRRDSVVSKARSQAVRRLKRALQDEQDSLVARMRTGEFSSVQALLGSPDDQAASYHRAVVKLLREVVRSGASSVPGSMGVERGVVDRTGTVAARGLADQVVADLRQQVIPQLESMLALDDSLTSETIAGRLADPYNFFKGDYLDRLVDERVGSVFDEGVALAR